MGKEATARESRRQRSLRAAEKALAEVIKADEKLRHQRTDSLGDFLQSWLQWKESAISPKTLSVYEAALKRVPDSLLKLPVGAVTGRKLDELYRKLEIEGASPYVIRQVHSALRSAFTTAVKWEMTDFNPAANASPPSILRATAIAPTAVEVAQIVEFASEKYGKRLAVFLHFQQCLAPDEVSCWRFDETTSTLQLDAFQ